jgi:hypothetical protein
MHTKRRWPKQGYPDTNQQYCNRTLMMYGIIKWVIYRKLRVPLVRDCTRFVSLLGQSLIPPF